MSLPTGELRQLVPDEEQIVAAEEQQPRQYDTAEQPVIPTVEEREKRTPPPPSQPLVPVPDVASVSTQEAVVRQTIYGIPIVRLNRWTGTANTWQELVRWNVSLTRTGDLNEISLLSDNDANTRYQIWIADQDQNIPVDRQTSTPLAMRWDRTVLPPGTTVMILVRTDDGTTQINVDGVIIGTER